MTFLGDWVIPDQQASRERNDAGQDQSDQLESPYPLISDRSLRIEAEISSQGERKANANGQRRRLDPVGEDLSSLPPTGMAPLLRELLAEYAATGMPPAYLPAAEPVPPITAPINPPEAGPA